MRLLITGADGFLGSYLIERFYKRDDALFLIGANSKVLSETYPKAQSVSFLDLNHDRLKEQIHIFKPDLVIHLAAYYTSSDSIDDLHKLIDANLLFLGQILDAVKETKLNSFIYIGSSTEYLNGSKTPDPAYLYSATKTAGKEILSYYAKTYGFKEITITPYNVYGGKKGRKRILDLLTESLFVENPIKITEGEQIIDFIHIDDLIDLFVKVSDTVRDIPSGSNFHAGTGKGYALKDVGKIIEQIAQKEPNLQWGAIPYRKRDTMYSVADISLQKELFGWQPRVSLEEGIERLIKIKSNIYG